MVSARTSSHIPAPLRQGPATFSLAPHPSFAMHPTSFWTVLLLDVHVRDDCNATFPSVARLLEPETEVAFSDGHTGQWHNRLHRQLEAA
jgi:hypothetical protein